MSASVTDPEMQAQFAELEDITGITFQEWTDTVPLPADERNEIIQDWKTLGKLGWVVLPDKFARAMTLIGIVGEVAGAAGNVVGLGEALKAL